jgi:hypothetical protein
VPALEGALFRVLAFGLMIIAVWLTLVAAIVSRRRAGRQDRVAVV